MKIRPSALVRLSVMATFATLLALSSGCATSYLWTNTDIGVRHLTRTGITHAYALSNTVLVTFGEATTGSDKKERLCTVCVSTTSERTPVCKEYAKPARKVGINEEPVYTVTAERTPLPITSPPIMSAAVPIQMSAGSATSSAALLGECNMVVVDHNDPTFFLLIQRTNPSTPPDILIVGFHLGDEGIAGGDKDWKSSATWWRFPMQFVLTPIAVACDIALIPVVVVAAVPVAIGIATGLLPAH